MSGSGFFDTLDREGRFGEWMTSAALLVMAIIMMLPGDTLAYSPYRPLRDFGVNETLIVGVSMGVAVLRMCALVVNGLWRRTPMLRGIGAVAGMLLFSSFAVISAWPWILGQVQTPGLTMGFFALFAAADARGAYRAGVDSRHAHAAI